MINEEVSNILLRNENRRLVESLSGSGDLWDLDASELLAFADAYNSLGEAMQEQLRELLDSQEDADINPNALDEIERTVGGFNSEIDEAVSAWRDANT